jgi:calcium-dependent protein kinase
MNTKPIGDVYKLDSKTLGKGTYGEVCAATHRDSGHTRAVKTIARSKIKNWDRFLTEVKIL